MKTSMVIIASPRFFSNTVNEEKENQLRHFSFSNQLIRGQSINRLKFLFDQCGEQKLNSRP